MEANVTKRYSLKNLTFLNVSQEEEDPRVLATSYTLYKIGKCCPKIILVSIWLL